MKNKNIYGYYLAWVLTEIISSHYSTTQNPSTFLTEPPGGSTTTLIYYSRAGTEGERMTSSPQPGLSSQQQRGYFNTDYQEQRETHYHHTFHLSSLLKASVCFAGSAHQSIQQRLEPQFLPRSGGREAQMLLNHTGNTLVVAH